MRALFAVLFAAALAAAPLAAQAQRVYRWTDDNGVVHYTTNPDSIPRRLRPREPDAPVEPPSAATPRAQRQQSGDDDLDRLPPPRQAPALSAPAEPAIVETERAPLVAPPPVEAPAEPPAESDPDDDVPGPAPVSAQPPEPSPPEPSPPALELAPPPDPARELFEEPVEELPARPEIRELEERIERDRELMKNLISQSGVQGRELLEDPRFRELAERLPRLQSELDALRDETTP
jgi:hypothetical protein